MEVGMLVAGALLSVLGLVTLVNLPKEFLDARREDREATRATGHVIELVEEPPGPGGDSDSSWHPVVRFEDEDGREHVFESRFGTIHTRWKVGDPIAIAYPPSKPEAARLDTAFAAYHTVLVVLLFVVVFLGAGPLLILLAFFHD